MIIVFTGLLASFFFIILIVWVIRKKRPSPRRLYCDTQKRKLLFLLLEYLRAFGLDRRFTAACSSGLNKNHITTSVLLEQVLPCRSALKPQKRQNLSGNTLQYFDFFKAAYSLRALNERPSSANYSLHVRVPFTEVKPAKTNRCCHDIKAYLLPVCCCLLVLNRITAHKETTTDQFVVEIAKVQLCLFCFMFLTWGEFQCWWDNLFRDSSWTAKHTTTDFSHLCKETNHWEIQHTWLITNKAEQEADLRPQTPRDPLNKPTLTVWLLFS